MSISHGGLSLVRSITKSISLLLIVQTLFTAMDCCFHFRWVPEPGALLLKFCFPWPPVTQSRQDSSLYTERADLGQAESQYWGGEVSLSGVCISTFLL